MNKILVMFLLLACTVSVAGAQTPDKNSWQKPQIILAGASLSMTAVDCAQTASAMSTGQYVERNPFLPKQMDAASVWVVCSVAMGGQVLIADSFSRKWRTVFLSTVLAFETWSVFRNFQVRGSFHF